MLPGASRTIGYNRSRRRGGGSERRFQAGRADVRLNAPLLPNEPGGDRPDEQHDGWEIGTGPSLVIVDEGSRSR
jgi:hypothetical protein